MFIGKKREVKSETTSKASSLNWGILLPVGYAQQVCPKQSWQRAWPDNSMAQHFREFCWPFLSLGLQVWKKKGVLYQDCFLCRVAGPKSCQAVWMRKLKRGPLCEGGVTNIIPSTESFSWSWEAGMILWFTIFQWHSKQPPPRKDDCCEGLGWCHCKSHNIFF